ncbi:MAG: hypothetical protein ACOC12_00910 [Bacteroidota bacterium]
MRKLKKRINNQYRTLAIATFLTLISWITWAQSPTHIPRETSEPVGFFESTENIVFFVVIPLLIVVFYLLWRRNVRKRREQEEQ